MSDNRMNLKNFAMDFDTYIKLKQERKQRALERKLGRKESHEEQIKRMLKKSQADLADKLKGTSRFFIPNSEKRRKQKHIVSKATRRRMRQFAKLHNSDNSFDLDGGTIEIGDSF
jgi:guanylate kinase